MLGLTRQRLIDVTVPVGPQATVHGQVPYTKRVANMLASLGNRHLEQKEGKWLIKLMSKTKRKGPRDEE